MGRLSELSGEIDGLAAPSSDDEMGIEAREAIRIADKHLPKGSIDDRQALALDIIDAITKCQRDFGNEVIRRLTAVQGRA
ncbi:hypothetical protein V1291_000012 [Nitrobacteraceae bacterium AZCC 1564]